MLLYERYRDGLKDLPIKMNPICDGTEPNYWLSALIIDENAMCKQVRDDSNALYVPQCGKSCPTEILEAIASINAEGRPIWKPMHMQPIYKEHDFISVNGDVGGDVFNRGVCLPSDIKMTEEEQEEVINIIRGMLA